MKRWTLAEDARLRELVADGLSYLQIAPVIGRSAPACRQRGSLLDLRIDPATLAAMPQRCARGAA